MKIQTVSTSYPDLFEKEVNCLLEQGWELHGDPQITTVAIQNEWDGRLGGYSKTTYVQILKKQ